MRLNGPVRAHRPPSARAHPQVDVLPRALPARCVLSSDSARTEASPRSLKAREVKVRLALPLGTTATDGDVVSGAAGQPAPSC